MKFERKTSQNPILLILSDTQEPEVVKLEAISIMGTRNQTHLLTVSMRKNSYFNNTEPLVSECHRYTCIFVFHSDAKNW